MWGAVQSGACSLPELLPAGAPEMLVSTLMALIAMVTVVKVPQVRYSTCLYPSSRSTSSSFCTTPDILWDSLLLLSACALAPHSTCC
jgi:hypothetical protein